MRVGYSYRSFLSAQATYFGTECTAGSTNRRILVLTRIVVSVSFVGSSRLTAKLFFFLVLSSGQYTGLTWSMYLSTQCFACTRFCRALASISIAHNRRLSSNEVIPFVKYLPMYTLFVDKMAVTMSAFAFSGVSTPIPITPLNATVVHVFRALYRPFYCFNYFDFFVCLFICLFPVFCCWVYSLGSLFSFVISSTFIFPQRVFPFCLPWLRLGLQGIW